MVSGRFSGGLKRLYDWILFVRQNFPLGNQYGQFWHQNETIRRNESRGISI